MRYIDKLFFWEVIYYQKILKEYIDNIYQFHKDYSEGKIQTNSRDYLMKNGIVINKIFVIGRINSNMLYGSHALGHYNRSIIFDLPFFVEESLKDNLFRKNNIIIDIIDKYKVLQGVLENGRFKSLINIINPFIYLDIFSGFILKSLFSILGYENIKETNSFFGFLKIIVQLLMLMGTIWPILESFGYEKVIVNIFK